jgi:hypothetical protein
LTFEQRLTATKDLNGNISSMSPDYLIFLLLHHHAEIALLRTCFLCLHTFFPPAQFLNMLTSQPERVYPHMVGLFTTICCDKFQMYLEVFLTHVEEQALHHFCEFLAATPAFAAHTPTWLPFLKKPQLNIIIPPPRPPTVTDFHPFLPTASLAVVADMLSIIEYEIISQIRPVEFVPFVKGITRGAPNINHLTDHFNFTTSWLISEIVSVPRLADRVNVVSTCISLGHELLRRRNLMGLFAVVCALNSAPVSRMKRTWAALDRERRNQFTQLETIVTPVENYRNYRLLLEALPPPIIPNIGVVIGDLTFILDGNPDRVNGQINWLKCRMIRDAVDGFLSRTIGSPALFGSHPLSEEVLLAKATFITMQHLTDSRCYQLSLRIDPRANYEDAVVELLAEEKRLLQEVERLSRLVAVTTAAVPLTPSPRPVGSILKAEIRHKIAERSSLMLQQNQTLGELLAQIDPDQLSD